MRLFLTVQHPNPWHQKVYHRKRWDGSRLWDGNMRFFKDDKLNYDEQPEYFRNLATELTWPSVLRHAKPGTFPTGLLPEVLRQTDRFGLKVELEDRRKGQPKTYPVTLYGIEDLYDYQQEAVRKVIQGTLHGLPWNRGVVKLATRAGKTACMAAIAGTYRDAYVMVLSSGGELIDQTRRDIAGFLREPVGLIGDGEIDIQRITVCSSAMLNRHLSAFRAYFDQVTVKMADECHSLGQAETWQDDYHSVSAFVSVGFSATPNRNDNKVQQFKLAGSTGDVLIDVSPKELIDQGKVVDVHIRYELIQGPMFVNYGGISYPSWDLAWTHMRKYKENETVPPLAYEHIIVKNPERNDRIVKFFTETEEQTLGIVEWKEHGELLAQQIGCRFVTGDESMKERRKVLKEMNAGRIKRVIGTRIWDRGLTMPGIHRLSLCAGMKSEVAYLQRIGRGMMKLDGKPHLLVQDFLDAANQYTHRHSQQRMKEGEKAGFTVEQLEAA
jgi:superfamily II DNA or RNA helicase